MEYGLFAEKLKLAGRVAGIRRVQAPNALPQVPEGCTFAALKRAMAGETIYVTADTMKCKGGAAGFGLSDALPDVPGGFGYFLSCGRGEGFPPGERVKKTPRLGEDMLLVQPKDVMGGKNALRMEAYRPGGAYDTVTALVNPDQLAALVNPDQLAALVHLFNFEKPDYDNVIAPMSSGCASVLRIPFGELARGDAARAVIGNIDVFSRPHFPPDSFFFTVRAALFDKMRANADESVLAAPIWKGVEKRLAAAFEGR